MSALYARGNAIIPLTPNETHVDKEGYLVTFSGTTASLSASATVVATGVILEGQATTGKSSIGILGALAGTVRLKASGTITAGARVQQSTDGSIVTDAASGARVVVGVALESGVSGDLIEVATFTPTTLA